LDELLRKKRKFTKSCFPKSSKRYGICDARARSQHIHIVRPTLVRPLLGTDGGVNGHADAGIAFAEHLQC
jgi:hypothetical protein